MCKYVARVGLSLQLIQTNALRPIRGMTTGTVNLSLRLQSSHLRKEEKKQSPQVTE